MILSEFKGKLKLVTEVNFIKKDGTIVPKHFHITEVGQNQKRFIDCGGTVRNETTITMQLWESIDFWHRLDPTKLLSIIELSEQKLGLEDQEIEIEYQSDTIGKYGVDFSDGRFVLTTTNTECLASDKCGIPSFEVAKQKIQSRCTPGSGCC